MGLDMVFSPQRAQHLLRFHVTRLHAEMAHSSQEKASMGHPSNKRHAHTSHTPLLASILVLSTSFIAARAQTINSFQNAGLTLHYTIAGQRHARRHSFRRPGHGRRLHAARSRHRRARPHCHPARPARHHRLHAYHTRRHHHSPALYLSDLERCAPRSATSSGSCSATLPVRSHPMSYAIAHPDHTQALVLLGHRAPTRIHARPHGRKHRRPPLTRNHAANRCSWRHSSYRQRHGY